MVHEDIIERRKAKPRGRPFQKGHKKGKVDGEIVDASGRETSVSGGVIAPHEESLILEPVIKNLGTNPPTNKEVEQVVKKMIEESSSEVAPSKEDEVIESINFMNGDNKLEIRFSKRHNRAFRIQVFLNGETEIRPVSYTGSATGLTFWNLLKGAMKK